MASSPHPGYRPSGSGPRAGLASRLQDKRIKYVGNYGQDTVIVSSSGSENEQQRTFYRGETEDHALEVEIIDEPCTDSMNGLEHPFTVSIAIDGETYNGCGRNLE